MVWPFSRRRGGSPDEKPARPKRLEEEDHRVLTLLVEWVDREVSGHVARLVEDAVQVHREGHEEEAPLVVAYARKGKLTRLEVREQTPRALVDEVVRAFEKQGLWSFNGVVRTVGGQDPE